MKNLKKAEDDGVLRLGDFLHEVSITSHPWYLSHSQILGGQIPDPLRNNPRHKVQRLYACRRVIPAKQVIQSELECSEGIVGRGGCSEVRKGTYGGEEFAVKCPTFNQHVTSEKILKVSCAEYGIQVVDSWL